MCNNKYKKNITIFLAVSLIFFKTFSADDNNSNNFEKSYIENDNIDKVNSDLSLSFLQKVLSCIHNNVLKGDLEKIYIELFEGKVEIKEILKKIYASIEDKKALILSFNEAKLLFQFLYNFLINLSIKQNLELKLDTINFDEIINSDLLHDKLNTVIEIISNSTQSELYENAQTVFFDVSLIDDLNNAMQQLIILLKSITTNINKKNYNKNILSKIPYFQSKSVKQGIILYQNQMLYIVEDFLGLVQENILVLNTLRSTMNEMTNEKKTEVFYSVLEKVIHVIGFVKYGLNKKFMPDKSELSQNVKKFSYEKIAQSIKKQSELIQKRLVSDKNLSIADQIEILKKMIKDCIEEEHALCLYLIQNIYRSMYDKITLLGDKNIFTKGIKAIVSHPTALFSGFFAWDMHTLLNPNSLAGDSSIALLFARISELYRQLLNPSVEYPEAAWKTKMQFTELCSQSLDGVVQELYQKINEKKVFILGLNQKIEENNSADKDFYVSRREEANSELKKMQESFNAHIQNGGRSYDFYNAHLAAIANQIDKDNFDFERKFGDDGKYANYCQEAKNAYKNNVTYNEFKNQALLEKRYIAMLTEKYALAGDLISENIIKEEAKIMTKQSIEVCSDWFKMQNHHQKLTYNEVHPPLFKSIGVSIQQVGRWALPISCGAFGLFVNHYLNKLENSILGPVKKVADKLHSFLMGEKLKLEDNLVQVVDDSGDDLGFDLYDSTFDTWRKQGLLNWFDTAIECAKTGDYPADLERIILIEGDSGSGKSTLMDAFTKTIAKEANKKQKVKVEVYAIDPKYFNKKVESQPGKMEELDILNELKAYLKSIKYHQEIIIIKFDEAHLLLADKAREADFLRFLTEVKDLQKNSKGVMFIIFSTNKPYLLPPEFTKNPNRISTVIKLPVPSFNDRIDIWKGYLDKLGMPTQHIDFEYLSGLIEGSDLSRSNLSVGCNVSHGNMVRLIQKAVIDAKVKNTIVTTESINKFIDDTVRKISFNLNNLDQYYLEQIANYYSSIVAITAQFKKDTDFYVFDMATVYPIRSSLEKKNELDVDLEVPQFGEIFYCKRSYQINMFDKKHLIMDIIKDMSGSVYCRLNGLSSPVQSNKNLSLVYSLLYEYYANNDSRYADVVKKIEMSKKLGSSDKSISQYSEIYGNDELNQKVIDVMKLIEVKIKIFYQNSDVENLIKEVKSKLLKDKMITNKDIQKDLIQKSINHLSVESSFALLMADLNTII